jgi:hypothetical protein
MLLLGRLVTFASRDLTRKRKARQAEAMAQRGQTQGQQGPPSGPPGMGNKPTSTPSPPMFPGMMPSTGRFTRPSGFSPTRESSPPTESPEDIDIDISTAAAINEWQEIRRAFEVFRNNLGPDFAPLSPEHAAMPEKTPFGPAQMYRTFSIAGIWMNYYMGLIVLYRSMPSMPPVAMAAAGIAAEQTAPWAYEMARIAAGLCEDLNKQLMVSTLVGAACIESAFCLFVAGVQVRGIFSRSYSKLTATLVQESGAETLAGPTPAQHFSPDWMAVSQADCRWVRVGVDQGRTARTRTSVRKPSGPRPAVPGLDLAEPEEDRSENTGPGGGWQACIGQNRTGTLCPRLTECRARLG